MPKILNIAERRQAMAEFFCDIEILRNEGEFEARVEGLTPNVMSLKSDNLEELLEQFQTRYSNLISENQELAKKIKDNEATALKLLGAIETLQYLNPPAPEPTEAAEPAEVPAA